MNFSPFCRHTGYCRLPQRTVLPPWQRAPVSLLPVIRRALRGAPAAAGGVAARRDGLLYVPAHRHRQQGEMACECNAEKREEAPVHVGLLRACLIQARKYVPIDRLEHLRSQLGSSGDLRLSAQLEEVIGRLEPPDSASSSRRSSISSHVGPGEAFQRRPVNLTPRLDCNRCARAAFPGELQHPGLWNLPRDQPQREPVGRRDRLPHQSLHVRGGAAEGVQLHSGGGSGGSR